MPAILCSNSDTGQSKSSNSYTICRDHQRTGSTPVRTFSSYVVNQWTSCVHWLPMVHILLMRRAQKLWSFCLERCKKLLLILIGRTGSLCLQDESEHLHYVGKERWLGVLKSPFLKRCYWHKLHLLLLRTPPRCRNARSVPSEQMDCDKQASRMEIYYDVHGTKELN